MESGKAAAAAVLLALMLVTAACGGGTDTVVPVLEPVSPAEAKEIIDSAPDGLLIIDVRSAEDYAQTHLPGAAHADVRADDFRDRIAELDREMPYVVYCKEGNRSQDALDVMRELEFQEVYDIEGGIIAWVEAGFPIVVPESARLETVVPGDAYGVIQDAPEGLVVLDVRTPEEFAEARIPGAVNLDFYAPDFADQLGRLDLTVPYVLYCRSGNRSGTALSIMSQLGFQEVYNVDGGIVAWSQAGLPVEAP